MGIESTVYVKITLNYLKTDYFHVHKSDTVFMEIQSFPVLFVPLKECASIYQDFFKSFGAKERFSP